MTYSDVYSLVRKMCDTFSWFHEVVNTFDVTSRTKGKIFKMLSRDMGQTRKKSNLVKY